MQPFQPDAHTLLLYHFDEGAGNIARDSSGHGYDGEIRDAVWAPGKFGTALRFDGRHASVFRKLTPAIRRLRQITVECWFNQDNPEGRQFLIGKDVTFHFDLSGGAATSLSLYNEGGGVKNADGLQHQQLGTALGPLRPGRWYHEAVTYDGSCVSFFLDGVLKRRMAASKDFLLGVESRGLWVGCYVGMDFWFSGRIDEVRVSDCVRYDPEQKLREGGCAFVVPEPARPVKAVRKPVTTGRARLDLTLKKLYGTNAAGWVYLKAPAQAAAIVGRYELNDVANGAEKQFTFDVSDEVSAAGNYILGLEPTDTGAYFAATHAEINAGGSRVASWTGSARSRRTFEPPVLVPLHSGTEAQPKSEPILLLPTAVDRRDGDVEIDRDDATGAARIVGDGYAEYWIDTPVKAAYRVSMRYAAPGRLPCDFVIDGNDLNDYNMCAVNRSLGFDAEDALWEYQGTTVLAPGLHWVRVQDVLPDIYGIRFDPIAAPPQRSVPWTSFPVPAGNFLVDAGAWNPQILRGRATDSEAAAAAENGVPALHFGTTFASAPASPVTDDCVRLLSTGRWDITPFGRVRFRFAGQGSQHVISFLLIDAKGDEKLLWRCRDAESAVQEIAVPLSFEGNNVFDGRHVTALCIELDNGNVNASSAGRFAGAIIDPVLERRDELIEPDGYPALLTAAKQSMAEAAKRLSGGVQALVARLRSPWTHEVVPEQYPQFAAAIPQPVTRKTLGDGLHFTGARSISADTLDDFHKYYDFGDVCWPHIGILPQRDHYKTDADYQQALQQMTERLQDVRNRGLYLFDIWGYVPYNSRFPFKVAPEHHAILLRIFGDRFLGYDNGEQDGRYIGSYSDRGKATDRKEGWDDFVTWDKHICDDGMNYMDATGSLNFSLYYGARGDRMLGLETAQGLPSDTMMFAFLRGAGKEYGRLIYQASSVWNRFGWNIYSGRKTEAGRTDGYGYGPHKGCSLSLHKRLFFCSHLGGHSIFGTETGQFTADRLENGAPELSPLGKQDLRLQDWYARHPDRGVMYTPVAFMLDFHNGWNPPRHLYRSDTYKIWGKFPYEKGDYLIDAMFRMVWPGYEDCSYFRNERGFITPTPYGDIFDVIDNHCSPDILRQYAALVLLGDVEMTPEVKRNLDRYVRDGGDLIIDAPRAKALGEELTGVTVNGGTFKGCMSRLLADGSTFTEQPYTYTALTPASAQALLVSESGRPLVTVNHIGKGRVLVGAVDYWMSDRLVYRHPDIVNMEPPYLLLNGVRALLGRYFDSFNPVSVEPAGLTVRTCFYGNDARHLLVGLINNKLFAEWRGTLQVRRGSVQSARELWHGAPLRPGTYMPLSIVAGDVAILDIRLK